MKTPRTSSGVAGTLAMAFTAAALSLLPMASRAQSGEWPQKPVRIVVPFLAGGSIDVVGRILAQELSTRTGQQFIVDNKGGAGGTIGADVVAKAAPDGYTMLFTAQGPFVINPFIMKRLPYDARTAFAPVTLAVDAPNVLASGPAFPYKTLDALLKYVRDNKGASLNYASQGVGTTGHVTGALLHQMLQLPLVHIAYNGFPPMLTDVASGRVDLMIADTLNVSERVRNGELRAIAVASPNRSTNLPDVPTFAELGHPEIVSGPWFAMVAPAGTPEAIRVRLAGLIQSVLKTPSVVERLHKLGVETRGSTPDELGSYMESEYKRWGAIIKKAGIVLNE